LRVCRALRGQGFSFMGAAGFLGVYEGPDTEREWNPDAGGSRLEKKVTEGVGGQEEPPPPPLIKLAYSRGH